MNGMNLEVFLYVIEQIFAIAALCGYEESDETKLSKIASMIDRGDCTYLKSVIDKAEYVLSAK
jgi:hypothetical protein